MTLSLTGTLVLNLLPGETRFEQESTCKHHDDEHQQGKANEAEESFYSFLIMK